MDVRSRHHYAQWATTCIYENTALGSRLPSVGRIATDCIPPKRALPIEASADCHSQSRQRWVETRRRWPEIFAEAVEIDAKMRRGLALQKTPYLHMLRMPLAEAVALDEAVLGAGGQADGFGNECEGHCGV